MGQRLVFKVIRGERMISTIYYHWSAYTESCYEEALYLIEELRKRGYNNSMTDNETNIMLLNILLDNRSINPFNNCVSCGGPNGGNFSPFVEIGYEPSDKMFNVDRNDGLISINENSMNYDIMCAEYICEFNFDTETVSNTCFNVVPQDPDDWVKDFSPENLREIQFPDYIDSNGFIKWDDTKKAITWAKDIEKKHNGIVGTAYDIEGNLVTIKIIY